jgi:hypothetical protein
VRGLIVLITVIAMNEGHNGRWRTEDRFFPNGEEVTLYVLDQDDDPPKVKRASDGRMVSDPKRIGRRSFEEIKADNCLKILSDSATRAGLSQASLDAAKASAAAAGERAVELGAENAALKARIVELETKVGDLEQAIEKSKPSKK